jgi:hypothetical protein
MGKLHFTPLKYPPIFTFISKGSSVTFNPPKLLNCDNLTHLTYLFPKCFIIFFKKKIQKKEEEKAKQDG